MQPCLRAAVIYVDSPLMPKSVRTCRCISLHTYPALVTLDGWHLVTHICHCGRVHFEEELPAVPVPRKAARRRAKTKKRR